MNNKFKPFYVFTLCFLYSISSETFHTVIKTEEAHVRGFLLACERQMHFWSSLLSLQKITSANLSDKTISVM